MDNEKLLIGGIVVIGLVLAAPFIYPLIVDTSAKNAAIDTQNMDRLNKAVDNYARINQQYPPSLHHLVPDYIAEVPLTATNRQFQYSPRTGAITNPAAATATAASDKSDTGRRRNSGGGGGTVATEALTGVGVSQELNF